MDNLIGVTLLIQIAVEQARPYESWGSVLEAAVCEGVKIARHLTSLALEVEGALLFVRMWAITSTYQR